MFRVSYPINENVVEALERYAHIKEHLKLPSDGNSNLEIVRLLDNQHYGHIKSLTQLINDLLPIASELGDKILKAKDPFELEQALAELFLFNHLYNKSGDNIEPKHREDDQQIWDISAIIDKSEARIEVYTPVELAGSQVFKSIIKTTLKYIDLTLGFDINIQIDTINP